jgi:type IV secretory pathway VirB4 component
METFTETDLKFKIPFGMVVGGPSGTGKSTFVMKLLANCDLMMDPIPKKYCIVMGFTTQTLEN